MSSLRDLVYSRRQSGQGVVSSFSGGVKERLKEKFDPRQLINQKGLMAALFPGLKTYKAKSPSTGRVSGESIEKTSMDISNVKPLFESIQLNTSVTAKNLSVLPAIHRDFNVIRQNLVKFLKLEKTDAATKADMYFKAAAKREQMYESQLAQLKGTSENSPNRLKDNKKSNFNLLDFLVIGGIFAGIVIAIKTGVEKVVETLDNLRTVDLKSYLEEFTNNIYDSIKKLLISEAHAGELPVRNLPDFKIDFPEGKLSNSDIDVVLKSMYRFESGQNYNISFGERKNKEGKLEFAYRKGKEDFKPQQTAEEFSGKPLTKMTVQEVMNFQASREKVKPGQSAVGAYQFMPDTLRGEINKLKKTIPDILDREFDQNMQDIVAQSLARSKMAELERLKLPVTQETLASSWGVGSGGTQAILKAIKEGRGNETVGSIMQKAGYPTNLINNPWMSQSGNQYMERQRQKIETTKNKMKNEGSSGTEIVPNKKPHFKGSGTSHPETSSLVIPDFSPKVSGVRDASKIDLASFDLSIREVENEIPFIIVNNNINQRTIVINKKQGRSIDPLKKLKTAVV
jgi:hypothetical protein